MRFWMAAVVCLADAEAFDSESFGLEQEPEELIAFARGLKQGAFGADPAAIDVGGCTSTRRRATKETLSQGWLRSGVAGAPFGPGAATFFGFKGRDYMIIHGWQNRCDDPADTCRTGSDPCPAGTRDNDCRFENPGGRSLYLFRVGLGAGGNPIAKAL